MAEMFPVAGAKIFIGGVLPTKTTNHVASDFTSQTWVEIDGWQSAGKLGDASEVIKTDLINRGRKLKQKGTRDANAMENVFAINSTDAGQLALIAAEKTSNNYAFRIQFGDALTTTGSTRFFIGMVTDVSEQNGEANTLRMMQGTLEINSNIVSVAAV